MMLQAVLGLSVDGWNREIRVSEPRLPIGIDRLEVDGLRIGEEKVDLLFERTGRRVDVQGRSRTGVQVRVR